jgi:Protein of unknown function (DUF998)
MKKLIMLCGVSAAILYVGTVILGGLLRPGYSHLFEAISELVADGAPNRSLLSSLFLVYNIVLSVFGIGLFLKVRDQSRGRISGSVGSLALTLLVGVAGILMELVFPQDPGGLPTTFAGTMHIVMASVASLGTMIAVLMLGLWFRNMAELKGYSTYSLISVAIIFISGGLTAAAMANSYPLFGLLERITIGTFIVWMFVIGLKMFQLEGETPAQMQFEVAGSTSKGK